MLVDGAAEAGEGPTRVLLLDPGLRRFEVRTSDGRSERFELTLASGAPAAHAVSATLAATTAVTVAAPTLAHAEAQAAFERGREAALARRNDQAAAAFHDAARLEPTPGTRRWLGVTLRGMGRYTESIAALERYLAAPEVGVAPTQLEEVGRAVGEMRRSLAQLTVTLQPTSAALQVDGRTRAMEAGAMIAIDPGAPAWWRCARRDTSRCARRWSYGRGPARGGGSTGGGSRAHRGGAFGGKRAGDARRARGGAGARRADDTTG